MTAETVYCDICSDNLDVIDICSDISNDESIKTISTTDTQPTNEDIKKTNRRRRKTKKKCNLSLRILPQKKKRINTLRTLWKYFYQSQNIHT